MKDSRMKIRTEVKRELKRVDVRMKIRGVKKVEMTKKTRSENER